MTDGLLLIAGLSGVFIAGVILLSTIGVLTSDRRRVSRSMSALAAMSTPAPLVGAQANTPFADRVLAPGMARLARLGKRWTPDGQEATIRRKLDLAGSPAGWDVDRIIAFKFLGLLAGAVAGFVLPLLLGSSTLAAVGSGAVSAALGFFGPNLSLYQSAYNRTKQLQKDLPDAMDLLTISVEAGLAFDAALSQVARNTRGPLADEFFRVLQEMQIGLGRSEAMRALGERTDLPELRGFVTAMIQADSFGIPIANVLRVQAKEMRIKRTQRAEEAAQKVPVKILFPLIFCILPGLFIIVIGPAGISIFRTLVLR